MFKMENWFRFSKEQQYRLVLLALLITSSLISIATLAARIIVSGEYAYVFLLWNLFLAWIPFGFAWVAYTARGLPKPFLYTLIFTCAVLWLLFLPNAPYILTDFQHLNYTESNLVIWYDVLMLMWFGWDGVFLGVISLYFMQRIVTQIFGAVIGWIFTTTVVALCSFGIYLGRFLRWNSWDVIQRPGSIASDVIDRILHPFSHPRTLVFTVLFSTFFMFLYVTILVFGHLIRETNGAEALDTPDAK